MLNYRFSHAPNFYLLQCFLLVIETFSRFVIIWSFFFSIYLPIISNLISWPKYFLSGYLRGRSNSLRVDDILLRRSNSLRFGLEATRRISSVEELGMAPSSSIFGPNPPGATPSVERRSSIKLPVNGSIGLEVRVWFPGTLLKYND